MDFTENFVTLVHRVHDNPYRHRVVNLVERFALFLHFAINAVKMLSSAENLPRDVRIVHHLAHVRDNVVYKFHARLKAFVKLGGNVFVKIGFQIFKA